MNAASRGSSYNCHVPPMKIRLHKEIGPRVNTKHGGKVWVRELDGERRSKREEEKERARGARKRNGGGRGGAQPTRLVFKTELLAVWLCAEVN